MNQIELPTTQNVILKYELPDLIVRIAAFLIDGIIISITFFVLSLLGRLVLPDGDLQSVYMILIIVPLSMSYTLLSEILMKGQTIGKKALGIKRIHLSGRTPDFSDYALVWSVRMLEIYSCLGTLAAIFVLGSENNQRLGDKLSNTIVIKTMKGNKGVLNEILKMNRNKIPEIVYPQIIKFTEEQVLFMKNCLQRTKNHPNTNTKLVLIELCNKVAKELSIEKVPHDKAKFITQLIKDYVILTR